MQKKIGIILQARMGSTRLPKKMILPFYKEKGILELLLNRIRKELKDIKVVVATTINEKDDKIVDVAQKEGCDFFRGSENDVLSRFIGAGESYGFDKVIRICADNPFLDIYSLKKMISLFIESTADYFCYSLSDGTPSILTHYGYWGEGVLLSALKKTKKTTSEAFYREHVTNYIYTHPETFEIEKIEINKEIQENETRLTIDTQEDFNIASAIYQEMVDEGVQMTAMGIFNHIKENDKVLLKMKEQIKQNTKK